MSDFIRPAWTVLTALGLLVTTGCLSSGATGPDLVTLVVVIETVGEDLDVDGYEFVLDDGAGTALPSTGEIRFENLSRGNYQFAILGISSNCRVTNQPTSGSIPLFGSRTVDFVVFCLQPDPGLIIYATESGGIRTRSPLGSDVQALPVFGSDISVTRDGSRIAYERAGDVWAASIDGSDPVNLTNSTSSSEGRPSWSADGTQIVFGRAEVGESTGDVYVMNADGSGATNLTSDTPDSTESEPEWSPDGTRIVFGSDRSGDGSLYTIRPDGSDVIRLTEGAFDGNARWSPDGNHIVFARFLDPAEGGTDFELFRIESDGVGLTQLTNNAGFRTTDADWSPDGEWMVIASLDLSLGFSDLYAMRADGTDIVRLTFFEEAILPRWVP